MSVKVSAQAVTESIYRLAAMDLTPASVSALEAFVVAKRLEVKGLEASIPTVNEVVEEVFVLFPDNAEKGRISFGSAERDDRAVLKWGKVASKSAKSGQSTVWNTTARGNKTAAAELFRDGTIRKGLRDDAANLLSSLLQKKGPKLVRPNRQALAVFLTRDALFDAGPDEAAVLAKLEEIFGITANELDAFTFDEALAEPLNTEPRWSPDQLPEILKPDTPHVASTRGVAVVTSGADVVVDERVMRMLRLAIRSSSAVMLVGPPGTGKTTLLRQVVNEIIEDPVAFGFKSTSVSEPVLVTPDESWTALELVGGKTVDEKGRLRFRPGFLLDAIRQDRWLILDEANRADMDKIFGPLLTWLSDQTVELGRATTGLDSPIVELAWHSEPECEVDPIALKQLEEETPRGDRITFLAGEEWRLLGTYNALDAQRVFRFGQALGRRFARVPIPCPEEDEFRKALEPGAKGLTQNLVSQVVALYSAHLADPVTMLGPAIFLRVPSYIQAGLGEEIDDLELAESGEASGANGHGSLRDNPLSEGSPESDAIADAGGNAGIGSSESQTALQSGVGTWTATNESDMQSLLAEAYLINAGTWVATLDDGYLATLGQRIIDTGALPEKQWLWVKSMLPALG